jgi:hypothetical protein
MFRGSDSMTAVLGARMRTAARRPLGAVLLGIAVVCGVVCGAGSAQAASGTVGGAGLKVAVSGTASAPRLVLANDSSAPCQVVGTSYGSVEFEQVEQGSAQVQPISADAWFDDSVPSYTSTQLRTLTPGQAVELPLALVSTASTGSALESIAWSDTAASTDLLYPLKSGEAVRLELSYAPPIAAVASGAPMCSSSNTEASALLPASGAGSSGGFGGISTLVLIGVAAVVLILLILAVFLFMRRRKGRAAAVVLILLAAGLIHAAAAAPPASATVTATGSVAAAWAKCSKVYSAPGGDPSDIFPTLNAAGNNVQIIPSNGDQTHEIQVPGSGVIIFWDPADNHPYVGGGNAEACSTLYHELVHAYQDLTGGQNHAMCWTPGPNGTLVNSGIPANEVEATQEQNQLRQSLGLPVRKTYGDKPLPSGACQPPPANPTTPNCNGAGCGNSNGDPHLVTFEGVHYDFQAAGEFVAADDPRDGFQLQLRQQPFPGSLKVAVNTAAAMDVAGDRVEVDMGTQGLALLVNGVPRSAATLTLPHGGTVATGMTGTGQLMTVTWPDSSVATINQIGTWGLHVSLRPAAVHAGHLRGLLGNLGGDPADSVQTASGTAIAKPSFSTVYPAFANSWRITEATSLFTYAAGTSTATYTDLSFPHAPATSSQVPDLAQADAQCAAAGITDQAALQDCELDVGLTGQPDFAAADATTQASEPAQTTASTAPSQPGQSPQPTQNAGGFAIGGPSTTVRITSAGGTEALHFTGQAGQVVFVNVPSTTLPAGCGSLEIEGPTGIELNDGCISGSGAGYIPATTLSTSGQYTVLVGAQGAGSATLQLIQDLDQTETITPDGAPVTATIGQPGAKSDLTFDAAPGTNVFIEMSDSTLTTGCADISLEDPVGINLNDGCISGISGNGSGFVPATLLTGSGTYTIAVAPGGTDTGSVVVTLILDHDQNAPITVGGPPVTATIAIPGEVSSFTFQGTAGETVAVQATDTQLDGCGELLLVGPNGADVEDGCLDDGSGSIAATKLPTTGRYTIQVDPGGTTTGSAVIRLTSG